MQGYKFMGEKENEKKKTEEKHGVSILTMKSRSFSWLFLVHQHIRLWFAAYLKVEFEAAF